MSWSLLLIPFPGHLPPMLTKSPEQLSVYVKGCASIRDLGSNRKKLLEHPSNSRVINKILKIQQISKFISNYGHRVHNVNYEAIMPWEFATVC